MKRITQVIGSFLIVISAQVCANSALVAAAKERLHYKIVYDGSYLSIDYPMGDVSPHIGVCTDLIIRSYRAIGIDLQQLVHEDMRDNFAQYPSNRMWGLTRTDTNIDHRRVPNLQTFFARQGASLTISKVAKNYQAGDIVTWMLPGNLPHIGIVVDEYDEEGITPLIAHNIGQGPKLDNILFQFPITGHYRVTTLNNEKSINP